MKSINPMNSTFAALFGEQQINTNNMSLAPYCLIIPCDYGSLAYNGLSRELILFSNEESKKLNDINSLDDEISNYLKKGWFFIPDDASGKRYCDQMLNTVRIMRTSKDKNFYKRYTIMTTLECNARCFYCFEKGKPQPRMSIKTANDIADYILSHSPSEGTIEFSWFGGEPLYNTEVIDVITNRLKSAGRKYISTMVSNGYLVDKNIIKKAKDNWNIKRVQITLDGTEKVYNRSKNYIYANDISPFKKVISNIKLLLDNGINVRVRLNLGLYNVADLYELVDFLATQFSEYKNFSVYSHRLYDYDGNGKQIHKEEEIINTIKVSQEFNEYLIKKNLYFGRLLRKEYRINHCMGDSSASVVITPEGKLTKCEHFSDREIVGDIYSDQLDTKLLNEWKELQPSIDICEDCPAYIDCLRLKKCPNVSPNCDIHQKAEEIQQLKLKILNTYTKWKEKSDNKKTGD